MPAIFDQGAFAPCPAPFNLAAHVLQHADAQPDKIALSVLGLSGAERWSYGRLSSAVRGVASGLLSAGLEPGQIVLMRLGNTVDFPLVFLGAIAAGLVPVPTSAMLTEREVAKMIGTLQPAAIVRASGVACPPEGRIFDETDIAAWCALPPAEFAMGDPDRLAYIVFTSGTSGNPHAVMHAHRAIWARQMMVDGWYGLTAQDRVLHAGAFNWTYTLGTGLMDPWAAGATALIPADGIDAQALPLLLKRHEATIFAAAPGVYRKILQHHPKIDLPKLHHGLTAGEKLSDAIHELWKSASGTELYEAFGMSECSTFISSAPDRPSDRGSLGRPQPGRRVALIGPDDAPVAFGEEGVIAIHRDDPGPMLGYLGAEEATAARFRGDWSVTGDLGVMDESFQITYLGRGDDMMNAGGYRVSPIEVERALSDIPGITEVGVTDCEVKADARLIIAFYTGPAPLDETALAQAAAERLARYKQPRAFLHVPDLPKNPNGKLQRRALRDVWAAAQATKSA